MYRRSQSSIDRQRRKAEAMRRGRERAAMAREPRGRPPDLPHLRREVVVTDYDTGQPVRHVLRLYRTNRVDTYLGEMDGEERVRMGWSVATAALRRLYQRVPSPRSDFWW